MFFGIFSALCKQRGVKRSRVAREIGLSNSTVTKWKNKGSTPDSSTLTKLAAYFGVSVSFLLGDTSESRILWMQNELEDVKKAYEEETDPDLKDELASKLDYLIESLDDELLIQRIMKLGETKKAPTDNGERSDNDVMAAFFGGYADDLTPEEKDGLWRDAQDYARFKAEQMRKGRNNRGNGRA